MPIRVLIIDSHEIVRAGIKMACETRSDLQFVGEASTLEGATSLAIESSADVVVVDPTVSGPEGLIELQQLHLQLPTLRILAFTNDDGPEFAQAVIAAGASGYLIKDASIDEMAVAIGCVHQGRVFISHSHAASHSPASVVNVASEVATTDAAEYLQSPPQLSGRESEVLSLLADGLTNKQAAERLFLSVKTVETYRSRIMKKHGLRDRAELVQFAKHAARVASPSWGG